MARTSACDELSQAGQVRSVWSIWSIWLVWFNQIDETDRTDQMNKTGWRTLSASCESKPRSDIAHLGRPHMHLVGVQRLACFLLAGSRLHSLTSRHLTARPSFLRLVGPPVRGTQTGGSVSDRCQIQRLSTSTLTQTVPAPASATSPERAEDTRPLRPCARLLCPRVSHFLTQHVSGTPWSCQRRCPKSSILRMSTCASGPRHVGAEESDGAAGPTDPCPQGRG